jgi:hypothetical protein
MIWLVPVLGNIRSALPIKDSCGAVKSNLSKTGINRHTMGETCLLGDLAEEDGA